jgi:hypothetical protein
MPGRAEGGKPHPQTSPLKYSPTKSTPYPKTRKTLKKSPALFSTARESPAQSPRSALGYTARRCGEAGPALVVKGYANLHHRGLAAISPVVRERGSAGFGPAGATLLPSASARCALARKPLKVAVLGHGGPVRPPPGVPTAHRLLVERDREELEAKVRRYTGTRCICPAPEMVRTDRLEKHRPGLADADLAKNGSTLPRASINRRGSGRRQMWPNWQAGCFSNEAPPPGR